MSLPHPAPAPAAHPGTCSRPSQSGTALSGRGKEHWPSFSQHKVSGVSPLMQQPTGVNSAASAGHSTHPRLLHRRNLLVRECLQRLRSELRVRPLPHVGPRRHCSSTGTERRRAGHVGKGQRWRNAGRLLCFSAVACAADCGSRHSHTCCHTARAIRLSSCTHLPAAVAPPQPGAAPSHGRRRALAAGPSAAALHDHK